MTRIAIAVAAATALAPIGTQAGSASLNVVVNVVTSSGACGTSVAANAVAVSCGSFASLPVLPPVSVGLAPTAVPSFVSTSFASVTPPFIPPSILPQVQAAPVAPSPSVTPDSTRPAAPLSMPDQTAPGQSAPPSTGAPDQYRPERDQPEQPAQDEEPAAPVAVLPVSGPDNNPIALYSKGANLSSWRVVSNDNVQHVQLTIAW